MNIQQLELAIRVAETGSISKAASELFLSQPNVSSSVKALERELGFNIFQRTNTGISLTERGEVFLEHARIIMYHAEALHTVKDMKPICRFRLGTNSYSPTITAFQKFCSKYSEVSNAEFSCQNISIEKGIKLVYGKELDLCTAIFPGQPEDFVIENIKHKKLLLLHIKDIPLNINISKNHPMAQRDKIDLVHLCKYPVVEYFSGNLIDIANQLMVETQIGYKYSIKVDNRDLRCKLVASTNAFSVGCQLPPALLEEYGLSSFRLHGEGMKLFAILRHEEDNVEEIKHYLSILREELEEI